MKEAKKKQRVKSSMLTYVGRVERDEAVISFKGGIMSNRRSLLILLSLVLMLQLQGCGGGGGGAASSTATPIGTPVSLAEMQSFDEATAAPGTAMSFNLAGTLCNSTICNNIVGTLSTTVSQPTTTNGQTYNVTIVMESLTNLTTGETITGKSTTYVSQNGYVDTVVYDNGDTGKMTSETLLPAIARVGDTGNNYTTLSFSDGETETGVWRIDPGENGDAILVFSFIRRDSLDNLMFTEEDAYTIKSDGKIADMSLTDTVAGSGVTLKLSGNRL